MHRFGKTSCQAQKKPMKRIVLYLSLCFLVLSAFTCKKTEAPGTCFKGRLAKKGICLNYTITVEEGNIDPSLVEASWQDSNTGTSYQKAFRLANPCKLPASIEEGEVFYFQLEEAPADDCIVCQAYYPTPAKALAIKVINAPCN
jgi:hypothetical protein